MSNRFNRCLMTPVFFCICFFSHNPLAYDTSGSFKLPGKFVNLGLHVMYIDCQGDGSPTILIDVGLGDSSANWYRIAKTLAVTSRTCLYDRAGYGWSDPGPSDRTTVQIVHELNTLLETAGIPRPYLLVGHSFGGFTVRYFTASYPEKVIGAVLVESSHPEQIYRLSGLDRDDYKQQEISRIEMRPAGMSEFEKHWYALNSSRKAAYAQMQELKSFKKSAHQVKYAPPFPDIPLAILTRGKTQLPKINDFSLEEEWQDMQKDLLNLSQNSWQEIVENSGHHMYQDAPDKIIDNILKIISQAR